MSVPGAPGPGLKVEGEAGAPALLLLGSLGTGDELWAPQVRRLRGRFLVIRAGLPGHGGAPPPGGPLSLARLAQALLDELDSLGVGRFSLCGLSLGGMLAMEIAATVPERVERLLLASTGARIGEPGAWRARAARVRAGGMDAILSEVLPRWLTPEFREAEPVRTEALRRSLAAVDAGAYAALCELLAEADLGPRLELIRAPARLVYGAADLVTTPAQGLELMARLPGAGLQVLPGAGHLVNVERAQGFTELLLEHLLGGQLERGARVRREVLGEAHVDRAEARTSDFTADFQELLTRYAWGEVWDRPGLSRSQRRLVTLAALVAMGRWEELEMHVRAALEDGLEPDLLRELLLQLAVYCGLPAAHTAFQRVERVLVERDPEGPGGEPA